MKHISSILLFLFVFTFVECCSGRKIDSKEVVSLEYENEIKTRKSGEKKEIKENKESTGIPSTESPKWKEVNAVIEEMEKENKKEKVKKGNEKKVMKKTMGKEKEEMKSGYDLTINDLLLQARVFFSDNSGKIHEKVRHVYEDALNLMAELRTLVMDNEINEEERHWEAKHLLLMAGRETAALVRFFLKLFTTVGQERLRVTVTVAEIEEQQVEQTTVNPDFDLTDQTTIKPKSKGWKERLAEKRKIGRKGPIKISFDEKF